MQAWEFCERRAKDHIASWIRNARKADQRGKRTSECVWGHGPAKAGQAKVHDSVRRYACNTPRWPSKGSVLQ
jgi:hypothetical protein